MAEILDEYDDATPLKNTFCSKLTEEEYEEQGSLYTQKALQELIQHLEGNPDDFGKILQARKREESEEGVFSYLKTRFMSLFTGEYQVPESEISEKLEKLKENMIKSYNYSQESKGKRFSRRLVDRHMARELDKMATPNRGGAVIPPAPPLPGPSRVLRGVPPAPALPGQNKVQCSTPLVHAALTRRPISSRQPKRLNKRERRSGNGASMGDLFHELKGSECKRKLRKTANWSPGGTVICNQSKRQSEPDMMPFFNAQLINKFKNTQSPIPSPTMASPGAFESPISTWSPSED